MYKKRNQGKSIIDEITDIPWFTLYVRRDFLCPCTINSISKVLFVIQKNIIFFGGTLE